MRFLGVVSAPCGTLETCPTINTRRHRFADPKSGSTVHDDARGIHREIELDAYGA